MQSQLNDKNTKNLWGLLLFFDQTFLAQTQNLYFVAI